MRPPAPFGMYSERTAASSSTRCARPRPVRRYWWSPTAKRNRWLRFWSRRCSALTLLTQRIGYTPLKPWGSQPGQRQAQALRATPGSLMGVRRSGVMQSIGIPAGAAARTIVATIARPHDVALAGGRSQNWRHERSLRCSNPSPKRTLRPVISLGTMRMKRFFVVVIHDSTFARSASASSALPST